MLNRAQKEGRGSLTNDFDMGLTWGFQDRATERQHRVATGYSHKRLAMNVPSIIIISRLGLFDLVRDPLTVQETLSQLLHLAVILSGPIKKGKQSSLFYRGFDGNISERFARANRGSSQSDAKG